MKRTFGKIAFDRDTRSWIMERVEPQVVAKLKRVFARVPEAQGDRFRFQDEAGVCADIDWFLSRYPLAISPADAKLLKTRRLDYETYQADLDRVLMPNWSPPGVIGLQPGVVIRRYQQQAIALLQKAKGLLLGDGVGLGKTYTSIGFLASTPDALPAAVVMDANLTRQWKSRIESISNLRVHEIKGTVPYSLPPADVYLFRYSNVRGWASVFVTGFFKAVIYDEIQALRNGFETSKGVACKALSENVRYRMGLSATPVANYGIEAYRILAFLFIGEHPLGTRDEFVREWCAGDEKRVRNPDALGAFLRERHLMLRRSKADVASEIVRSADDLVNRVVKEIAYDVSAEREVEDMARTLAIRSVSGSFVERGQAARDLDILLRQATGVAKAKGVADFVRILLDSGLKVVLAGYHRQVYEIWKKEFADIKYVMYTGSESVSQKNKSEDAFVNGDAQLFMISLRSGAGLDSLQAVCHTLVIGELDWSPIWHRQLEGRLDREGQTAEYVDSYYLTADGGSDPAITEILGLKSAQARGIESPYSAIETVQSDESRLHAMAKDWLARRGIDVAKAAQEVRKSARQQELELA
ncbi:SNF2-related protein [Bosea sp. RAC05]|uniref:SNF2-related protein n=1 Tax=Bosea sp. RAC05 TaxID=1842539 RepID=UPI00083D5D50|nr:DEAD/DEAH box helicase [Bosea sp. RAC05]AOG03061.1 hypothetical protein BSY19_4785 [Bosea sp. RAC05]